MSPTGTAGQGEVPDPTAAFKILGNETRLAILSELLETMDRPPSFSELRKRLGMPDGSQFNYHLRKLEPAYVVQTDGSERTDGSRGPVDGRSAGGYRLTIAGMRVTTAIVARTLVDQPTIPPFEVEGECVTCGGGLLARYEDEMVSVNCADCGQYHLYSFLPPGGLVDRTPEEVAAASDSYFRTCARSCMDGVCPGCAGRVRRSFLGPGNTLPAAVVGHSTAERLGPTSGPGFVYECEQCPLWYHLVMGKTLLFEPVVVEFFRDHGLDFHEVPLWTLPWCVPAVTGEYSTVISESPLRVAVRIPLEDETLTVTVDEDLEVVGAERTADGGSKTGTVRG